MQLQDTLGMKTRSLAEYLHRDGLDGLVITDNIDQFYLLGFYFYSGEAVLVWHEGGLVCITRSLYVQPLKEIFPFMTIIGQDTERVAAAVRYAAQLGLKRVGFDAAKENYLAGRLFMQEGFCEAPSYISLMRQVKDDAEVKALRDSCRIAYKTYQYILPRLKTGMSEVETAAEMEKYMRTCGASATSFLSIICFGENTANPHHETSDRKLRDNEAVLMDFGCIYHGYCSDITRAWWHGDKPAEEYTKIWNIVDEARRIGIAAEKPGVMGKEVDAAARGVIERAGYGEYFTHRLGHGVGLEIHEEPNNDQVCAVPLQPGHILTVEPGIYLPGKFGVRLEDTTVVTAQGADILTRE